MPEGIPYFSVIIPAFNAECTIIKCVQSVLAQTFIDFEIIIINDGSTDGTKSLLQNFCKKFSNIKIFHQDNEGVSSARNVGLALSTGEYIAFLDADDFWYPNKLNDYYLSIENHQPDLLYSNYTLVHRKSRDERMVQSPSQLTRELLLQKNWIGMSTAVVRRSALQGVRFRPLGHEDYDFWLQVFSVHPTGVKAVRVSDEPLSYYNVGRKSVSSNKLRSARWHWNVLCLHEQKYHLRLFYFFSYAVRGVSKSVTYKIK